MKIFITLITLSLSTAVFSNENKVIELHSNQTLDQIVLNQENIVTEDNNENKTISETENINDDNNSQLVPQEENTVKIASIESKEIFFSKINLIQVNQILNNAKNIKSKTLQNEFNSFLTNLNLDHDEINNRSIFHSIVKYFYNIGQISKSYILLNTKAVEDDEYLNFYNILRINYLLSTSQLESACNFKNELNIEINLQNNFIDKLEIFCLIVQGKESEAQLLNSIMLETEVSIDKNFQQLFDILLSNKNNETFKKELLKENYNVDLIFLYSAMARIAEVALNEEFLKVDPLNLAIPIILNKSTSIDLRLKAANNSFLNGDISKESLAALYQSVDFNSGELNKPDETIKNLSNNIELLMAFHFQFINIQIFPSERLEALINFWNFSKKYNLDSIAFALTDSIANSIDINIEYLNYSPQIAMSYINNNNIQKAEEWITFYEQINGVDDYSTLVNILINFHSSSDLNAIIEIMNKYYEDLINLSVDDNEELFFILSTILLNENLTNLEDNFEKIYDDRQNTTLYITENIQAAINNNEENKFLIYSIISLNNKEWIEIHPSHLKLILKGFSEYKNGILFKDIILEIFNNYKLL